MALPRDRTVPPNTNGYYHCISRCVRRAWLCGYDKVNDINYDYRRKWVEERILLLAEAFAVSIYAYAVMSNHLHVVLKVDATAAKDWSDEEVARRWCLVFPSSEDEDATKRRIAHIAASPEMVAKYRARLCNLSWYMHCLNEPIGRGAYPEDHCTDRFWEQLSASQRRLERGLTTPSKSTRHAIGLQLERSVTTQTRCFRNRRRTPPQFDTGR